MKYIVYLSGENIPLAREELKSVITGQNSSMAICHDLSRLLVIDTGKNIDFSGCAMVSEVSAYLSDVDYIESINFEPYKKTAINVRVIKHRLDKDTSGIDIEKKIGYLFCDKGAKIDLDYPEKRIRVYLAEDKGFVGEMVFSFTKEFSKRKASMRPFHMPVSLDPKLARVMINLAEAKAGDRLLDPFVGTGGILIEAGLMKCKAFGIDTDKKMADGTIKNLEHYSISNYIIKHGDAFDSRQIFGKIFDAVVTDLPYGRNTKTADVRMIAERFLEYVPLIVKNGGRVVVASNFSDLKIPDSLNLKNSFEIYIHRSMSKWVYVFEV